MQTTATIQLADLHRMMEHEQELIRRVAELEQIQAQPPITGSQAELVALIDLALPILRFAVANLPPETSPGWPYKELRALGETIARTAGVSADTRAVAEDFAARSGEIEPYEVERGTRPKKGILATGTEFGPQTEEARLVHEAHTRR